MQTEIHTFSEWGYPFIAEDFMGEFNYSREVGQNFLLGGAVIEKGDSLNKLVEFVNNLINDRVEAIMIELCHIHNTILEDDIITYITPILESNGYKDSKSYEHRLAFGKDFSK